MRLNTQEATECHTQQTHHPGTGVWQPEAVSQLALLKKILDKNTVIKLDILKDLYLQELQNCKNSFQMHNTDLRNWKQNLLYIMVTNSPLSQSNPNLTFSLILPSKLERQWSRPIFLVHLTKQKMWHDPWLLCMTLRHLFRSAELTNLINRYGHSENYSFSLELESALAKVLQES